MTAHGGKREGAGRKKGSLGINQEVKQLFSENAHKAAQSIIAISNNAEHPQQIKALEIVLSRSIGQPNKTLSDTVIEQFINDDITAIHAGLLLESYGVAVGETLRKYIQAEIAAHKDKQELFSNDPLPKC